MFNACFFVCLFAERARRKKPFVCLLVSLALGPYIYLLVGAFASLVYLFFSSIKLHTDDIEKCFPLQVVFFELKDDQWTPK